MAETNTNDSRGKRLCYRAWHRGTREMDLLLGPFADAMASALTDSELENFERLLEIPDPELHNLIMLGGDLPDAQQNLLLKRVRDFHGLRA